MTAIGPFYMWPGALVEFERLQRAGFHPRLPVYREGGWWVDCVKERANEPRN
jgi:hypothetical protein